MPRAQTNAKLNFSIAIERLAVPEAPVCTAGTSQHWRTDRLYCGCIGADVRHEPGVWQADKKHAVRCTAAWPTRRGARGTCAPTTTNASSRIIEWNRLKATLPPVPPLRRCLNQSSAAAFAASSRCDGGRWSKSPKLRFSRRPSSASRNLAIHVPMDVDVIFLKPIWHPALTRVQYGSARGFSRLRASTVSILVAMPCPPNQSGAKVGQC